MSSFRRRKSIFSFGDTPIERRASWILFLIGLGSSTQINIGGYTAISEFLLVLFLPINYFKNLALFRRDGLSVFIFLLIFWMVGVCFTDLYTHNIFAFWIRGMIPPVGILAALVAVYPQLKRNPSGFKWMLLGMAISGVISIFVFQHGSDIGTAAVQSGQISAVEAVVGYKLFWVGKLNEWLGLPIKGWYLTTPYFFAIGSIWFLAVYALLTGGRSAFAVGAVSAFFITFGGKDQKKLHLLKRNFLFLIVGLILFSQIIKFGYKFAATHGWMGEGEADKYYEQAAGKSLLQTLMAGRGEFFISLFAIKDHPLIGHGSLALDTKGYRIDFCAKYGDEDDFKRLEDAYKEKDLLIPAHSHITCYWLWAGIPGLLPWLWILKLFVGTLFQRLHVVPEYFGYFAMVIPAMLWHIFFSPFGSRINMAFVVSLCFIVKVMNRERKKIGLML